MTNKNVQSPDPFSDKMPFERHSGTYKANEKVRKVKSSKTDFKKKHG